MRALLVLGLALSLAGCAGYVSPAPGVSIGVGISPAPVYYGDYGGYGGWGHRHWRHW